MKIIKIYRDEQGNQPYKKWFESLKDPVIRSRIEQRIKRLALGQYGDCQPVGGGVIELRFFFGSGYRVYFGERKGNIILLLCGGNKSSQSRDIEYAKHYWQEAKNYD